MTAASWPANLFQPMSTSRFSELQIDSPGALSQQFPATGSSTAACSAEPGGPETSESSTAKHNRAGHGKSLLPACLHSHVQGLQDELRCHLRIDRPPQDSPAAQIHEGRQVRSSVRRRQVCNVRNPSAIELSRAEVAVEKVGIHRHVVVAVRCLVGVLAVSISDEAVGSSRR